MIYGDKFIRTTTTEVLVEVQVCSNNILRFNFKNRPTGFETPDVEAHLIRNEIHLRSITNIEFGSGILYDQLYPWAKLVFEDLNNSGK